MTATTTTARNANIGQLSACSTPILVPTFHSKPLRLKHSYKNHTRRSRTAEDCMMLHSSSKSQSSTPTDQQQHEDDPFLYFSLSANQADGKYYALEHTDDDNGSDVDIKPEGNTRRQRSSLLATEVHPLHESMFGSLFPQDVEEELLNA